MTLPSQKDIVEPLLRLIYELGGEVRLGGKNRYPFLKLAQLFPQITPQDLTERVPSGGDYKWDNLVRWARNDLCKEGELDRPPPYGVWRITNKGRARIEASGPVPPPPGQHDELIQKMREIGVATGRVVLTEYKAPYRYDVALAKNEYQSPDMVVEICDKGNVDKDFSSLNWARQSWNAKGLLITVDDRDFGKAQVVVGSTPGIHVMKAEDLRKLHALIGPQNVHVLRVLFQ